MQIGSMLAVYTLSIDLWLYLKYNSFQAFNRSVKGNKTMIELKSVEQLSKAIERAKTSSLFVRFVQFRQFRVVNRMNGQTYNVNFFVRAGRRFGHCDCKGGERGLV